MAEAKEAKEVQEAKEVKDAKEVKETKEVKDEAKAPGKEEKLNDLLPEQFEEEVDEEKKQRKEDIDRILRQFNKKEERTVTTADFPVVMKALDQNPNEKELQEYIAKYAKANKEGVQVIDNASIHEMVEDRLRDPDTVEELKKAFMQIADNEGKLTNQEFIHLMTTKGNPVDPEIVQAYIQYADQDKDGVVEIDNFVQLLMSAKK